MVHNVCLLIFRLINYRKLFYIHLFITFTKMENYYLKNNKTNNHISPSVVPGVMSKVRINWYSIAKFLLNASIQGPNIMQTNPNAILESPAVLTPAFLQLCLRCAVSCHLPHECNRFRLPFHSPVGLWNILIVHSPPPFSTPIIFHSVKLFFRFAFQFVTTFYSILESRLFLFSPWT